MISTKPHGMTAFVKEVSEQPDALLRLAAFYRGQGRARLEEWAGRARAHRRVVFAGMGTSEFAPETILGALAEQGIDADTRDAGEWLHYPRTCHPLTVLISQSGESVETRLLAEQLRPATELAAITNDEASSLARMAGLVLPLAAGAETAISTKTYVNTLALLYLMARALAAPSVLEEALACLEQAAEAMRQIDRAQVDLAAGMLADAAAIHFVARGPALVAAKQAALTFMEGARLPTAAHAGGAFRHGPFELADASLRCVFFIPDGPTRRLLEAMAVEAAGKGGQVVVITDAAVDLGGARMSVLRVSPCGEVLFPIAAAAIQAHLLDAVAAGRGLEAGRFRHGQKITVRE